MRLALLLITLTLIPGAATFARSAPLPDHSAVAAPGSAPLIGRSVTDRRFGTCESAGTAPAGVDHLVALHRATVLQSPILRESRRPVAGPAAEAHYIARGAAERTPHARC